MPVHCARHKLIARARRLYADEPGSLELYAPVYAVDSSIIDLSLELCPWANWTGTAAAVKLLTMLDLRGPLPAFVAVTAADYTRRALAERAADRARQLLRDGSWIHRLSPLAPDRRGRAFFVIRERPDVRSYVAAFRRGRPAVARRERHANMRSLSAKMRSK